MKLRLIKNKKLELRKQNPTEIYVKIDMDTLKVQKVKLKKIRGIKMIEEYFYSTHSYSRNNF